MLALHAGPIDFATLPFANVAELLAADAAAGAGASSATRTRWASSRCEDLGDVTLQAHLGAATPAEHAALYREAVALIELLQRRGAELDVGRLSALPASRSTSRS